MPSRKPSLLSPASSEHLRFRMPAEWEPHAATWLAWPHYKDDWPGKFEPIPWVYTEIVRYLSRHERVEILVKNASLERRALNLLERAHAHNDNIRFHCWPTNRVWTRDSGCIFVFGSAERKESSAEPVTPAPKHVPPLYAIKWRFNAWAKYPNWHEDETVGTLMAQVTGSEEIQPRFGTRRIVLEGGSIDVNGCGTLITTEECLLSPVQARNRRMKRRDYEAVFAQYLGAGNIIWLGSGIAGDDTHGHVDDITRFVSRDTVISCVEADPKSPNYDALRNNLRRLRDATTEDGRPLATIDLPMPAPVYFERRRLPASYANFYIANRSVLVPVFNDPNDRIALDILADIFPDREVVGIYSGDLIWGFGALHCLTQQQPALDP